MKTIKSMTRGAWCSSMLSGLLLLGFAITNVNAQSQPPNTLSILTYGASTGSADNKTAIQNCINDAMAQGKGVWIPAGTYTIKSGLSATGILIAGAGKTTSVIYRNQNSSAIDATQLSLYSCTVQDLGLDGNGTSRGVNASYGINMKGVGWLIQRVQIHHSDAGLWLSGTSGTAQDSTMLQTFGDGININNSGADANHAGANLTIQNCTQDGAGDDGFAINSQGQDLGWPNMTNPKVVNCTSINAFYANGIRVAGGVNSLVQSCLVSNTTRLCGIETSSFGSGGYGITNGLIKGNWVYGSGNVDESSTMKSSDSETVATYRDNILINSSHYGFQVGTPTYPNGGHIVFGPNNVIVHPALSGIHIQSGVVGAGTFTNNSVMNLNGGQTAFVNGSGSFTTIVANNNWQGLNNGTYKIVNLKSSLVLDAKSQGTTNGTPIEQFNYAAGVNQQWTVTSLGSGQYKITGVQSGKVLDVKGQSLNDGAAIQLYTDNAGANQKWIITPATGTIQGVQSGKLMEVVGSSTSPGALIDQSSSTGGQSQQWTFQVP